MDSQSAHASPTALSAPSAHSAHSASSLSASWSGSSKTFSCSTWSDASERALDRDYTQDSSLTPVDIEALIQTERLTKILDECIYKTKLAICLPDLVKEFHTLNSILSSENMDDLVTIFEQYEDPMSTSSLLNVTAMEEIKSGQNTLKNRLNAELGHLIYIMNSYPALKPKVEEMIIKMRLDYMARKKPPALEYLEDLERFRDLMVNQLSTLASEELAAKLSARKLEKSNAKLIKHINEMTEKLGQEKETFESKMSAKTELIKQLTFELEELRVEASAKLNQKILDSERQMVLASRAHDAKNDMLQSELAESQRNFDKMLADHVKDEKKLRARRFKVEMQLMSWLQKYDVEMTDKQAELDDFQQKYEEEMKNCKDLEEKIELQNIDYIPLMEERELEYHKEMTEKMEKFRTEHAARVIQGAWREVLANRAEKKKLMKIQKKMVAKSAGSPNKKKKKGKK